MPFDASEYATGGEAQALCGDQRPGLFVAATSLARKGRYVDATRVLRRALACGDCSQKDALDLQARIYAQQGLFLQAESCWREAKRLDRSSREYDAALDRLRRAHLSTGRFFHRFATVSIIVLIGLMLWQIELRGPEIAGRLRANETAVAEIRGDIADFQRAMQASDIELAISIADLRNSSNALDRQLNEQVGGLQKSLERVLPASVRGALGSGNSEPPCRRRAQRR